jgi:hypothetical protein
MPLLYLVPEHFVVGVQGSESQESDRPFHLSANAYQHRDDRHSDHQPPHREPRAGESHH